MRLSCQQEDLHRGLSAVSRAIPARSTLPITQHVLVEVSDTSITLSATDAETIAITYTIDADVEEPGAITLPSRLLADFVATLPHQPISMTLADRSRQVSLACARNTASVGGMDPDDSFRDQRRRRRHRCGKASRSYRTDRLRRGNR